MIFTTEEKALLTNAMSCLRKANLPVAEAVLDYALARNDMPTDKAKLIDWKALTKQKIKMVEVSSAAESNGELWLSEQLDILVNSLDMIQDHVESTTWVNPYPIYWCEDCNKWSDDHDITCRGAHVTMTDDGEIPSLHECLEQVCVEWDPQPGWPEGAEWAISSNAGIIAYYAERSKAFYDRLDMINSMLNDTNWKYPYTEWNLKNTIL